MEEEHEPEHCETLIHRARLTPDDEGFVGPDYRYSFKEVNRRVNRFASYLKQQGVLPGERVALLCKNNEHLAVAIYARGQDRMCHRCS